MKDIKDGKLLDFEEQIFLVSSKKRNKHQCNLHSIILLYKLFNQRNNFKNFKLGLIL